MESFSVPEAEESFCPVSVSVVSLGRGAALHGDPRCRLVHAKPVVASRVPVTSGELGAGVHCRGSDTAWRRLGDFVRARQLVAEVNGCASRLQAGSPWALDEMLLLGQESGDARVTLWAREWVGAAVGSGLVTRRTLEASFLRLAISRERFPSAVGGESVSGELAGVGESALWVEMGVGQLWPAHREVARAWCRGDFERVARYGDELVRGAQSAQRLSGSASQYAALASAPADEVLRILVSGYSSFLVSALVGPPVTLMFSELDRWELAGSALVVHAGVVSGSRVEVAVPAPVASLVVRTWAHAPSSS